MENGNWYSGKVVAGHQNGRTWNYPTANLEQVSPVLSLENGVYAAWTRVGEEKHGAMLYVGSRPTLGYDVPVVELHLLDYQGDLYGKDLEFQVVSQVRGEMKFETVDALVQRISEDEKRIREILKAC